ncbi:MAG TPA: succinate dehydrogenase cytochrome b subunit [Puia sp.]|jgi:succinate dehydrogenase / fumarate reductase cytochrome b subunit|nr:succinate dehydrogenase cytochrome b subunit [Puia sp.]
MKWSAFFTSSIGKKFIMSLTGIFLISFLVVHVGINACIWANDGGQMFNLASHFMATTVVIRIIEVGLFAGLLLHIIQGFVLEFQNRSKRKTGYAVPMGNKGSKWYSRSMGLLGTLLLFFLIIHLKDFWVPSRFTDLPTTTYNGKEVADQYADIIRVFQVQWVVIVYVLACLSLLYHLLHGFQSAFRTLGVPNGKYITLIKNVGIGFSIIVSLAFAMMPVSVYLGWVN